MNTKRARYKRLSYWWSEVENRYFVLIGALELSVTITVASEVEKRTRNHMVFTSNEREKTSGQSTASSVKKTSFIWDGHDEAVSVSTPS